MELSPFDTIYKGDFVGGGTDKFWKAKYEQDFGEFRINRQLQTYAERYWQIASALKPSNWFGYYAEDRALSESLKTKMRGIQEGRYNSQEDMFIISYTGPREIPNRISKYEFNIMLLNKIKGEEVDLNDDVSEDLSYINWLMKNSTIRYATELLHALGLDRLYLSIDSLYELLFHILTGDLDERIILSDQELSVLSSMNLRQLEELFHINVDASHAALIIYGMYGKLPGLGMNNVDRKRLAYVAQFSPIKIYHLYIIYRRRELGSEGLVEIPEEPNIIAPPYHYVANQIPEIYLERDLMKINETNYKQVILTEDPDQDMSKIKTFGDALRYYSDQY